jgi:DNA-binding MurR/RpiR family transcriptional regulator
MSYNPKEDIPNIETMDMLKNIEKKYAKLSKGQKRLADFVVNNYDKAVFMTAARLGEVVGVSESTVVRFATTLGFSGYPGFQKQLKEVVRNKLNSIQRMEVTSDRIGESQILDSVLRSDVNQIKKTLSDIDYKAFNEAVVTIAGARKVYVVGLRSCAPLASFLGLYLNLICESVAVIHYNSSSEVFEQMMRVNEQDVVIGISYPRYSMRTLKALEFASSRQAKVITLTDSIHSPINLYSSCNLIAKSDTTSIVDSLVAPLSVINALIVSLFIRDQKSVINTLEDLELIWDEYEVYNRDALNPINHHTSSKPGESKTTKPGEEDSRESYIENE